eukprot:CAMPEP_0119063806 /NCGR_PEP_ID=MMETSP1178-20130426/7044_1 /TAXON_ID=33656 /ORGANISM="unid sp, Strain CCMP2000" /LENGTH=129 /DNA_ID=CAMNT_0007045189 /DNA_START=180 /DNA_END=569 /DNA_ORIENTATION=+
MEELAVYGCLQNDLVGAEGEEARISGGHKQTCQSNYVRGPITGMKSRVSLAAAQDRECVQRFRPQHIRHLSSVEHLTIELDDLVAHQQASSVPGGPRLDLGDDVTVIEITAHLEVARILLCLVHPDNHA